MHERVYEWVYPMGQGIWYLLFFAGSLMVWWNGIKRWQRLWFHRKRLPTGRVQNKQLQKIQVHLEQLVITAGKDKLTVGSLLLICGLLGGWMVWMGYGNDVGHLSWVIGLLAAGLPYVLLRVRLACMRQKGSLEGETFVSELLRQYRMCGCNIYESLEQTVRELGRGTVSRRLCFQCLVRMRNTGNPLVIREAANLFYYGIHTNWSRMLANHVRMAAETGLDVSLALEDVLIQLKQARVAYEERKRLNSEATRMTIYLIPVLYVVTGLLSVGYMDVGFGHLLKNQFGTAEGLVLFSVGTAMFAFNVMAVEVMNNRKFDC